MDPSRLSGAREKYYCRVFRLKTSLQTRFESLKKVSRRFNPSRIFAENLKLYILCDLLFLSKACSNRDSYPRCYFIKVLGNSFSVQFMLLEVTNLVWPTTPPHPVETHAVCAIIANYSSLIILFWQISKFPSNRSLRPVANLLRSPVHETVTLRTQPLSLWCARHSDFHLFGCTLRCNIILYGNGRRRPRGHVRSYENLVCHFFPINFAVHSAATYFRACSHRRPAAFINTNRTRPHFGPFVIAVVSSSSYATVVADSISFIIILSTAARVPGTSLKIISCKTTGYRFGESRRFLFLLSRHAFPSQSTM